MRDDDEHMVEISFKGLKSDPLNLLGGRHHRYFGPILYSDIFILGKDLRKDAGVDQAEADKKFTNDRHERRVVSAHDGAYL